MALYKDSNHINTKAAQFLGERYLSHEGNPFSGSHITGSDSQAAGTDLQQKTSLTLE
jgi:hypothetical protein